MKSYNIENQKLMRRVASLFIIMAMLLTSVFPVGAAEDNVVSVSSISFDDGNGNTVESLDGLSKVRAEVTVKTKSSQKMIFVLALYGKNNKLIKIDRDEKRATTSGTTFEASIEYDLPDNAEGYKLNAFLLDSVKGMNAIARGSLFPSGNLELSNLFVTLGDNDPVDLMATGTEKNGVFKIDVPLDIEFTPSVKPIAVDNGTKVEVTPPTFFPGYTDIKLTATNGATKKYRIEYVAKSAIVNVAGAMGTNFHAADDTTEDYGSAYWFDRATPAYSGADLAYYNDIRTISDEWDYLKGSTYYMAAVSGYVNPIYKSDRSTTVRVFGTAAITGDGWTSATNADGHISVSHTSGAGVEGHSQYQAAQKMTVVSSKTFPAGTVTLPAINRTFVVVVEPAQYIPESHRAFLTESITVNGNDVDTSKGPGVYNVPIDSDVVYTPEITEDDIVFANEDGSRIVEITGPTSFPGQSVIKVSSGADSAEYVINYVLDNLVANTSNNMGSNFHAADDANAVESGGHLRGSRVFMDRDDATIWIDNNPDKGVAYYNDVRSICTEYDFLNGSTYFMTSAAGAVNTKFTVGREADVYVFTAKEGDASGTSGWDYSENSAGYLELSSTLGQGVGTTPGRKLTKVYHKRLAAGEIVNVTPTIREALVVLKLKGYIEKGLTLTDLTVDGKTVEGFSSDRRQYNVEIPASTVVVPKVTATADNAESVIEITDPDTFPGKTVVNVSYGDKSVEYVINYVASQPLINATTSNYRTGFCAADDANAAEVGGVKVGSQLYADRSCPVYVGNNAANGIAYYNDIRSIADDWDYLNGADYFISAIGNRTATFKLNRPAVVRVFSSGINAISVEDGWKHDTYASGYVVSSTTTGEDAVKFTNMFYKSFKAGDTVSITPAVKESITVIDYAGYSDVATMLSDISVNGESLKDFDMSKMEYNVEIGPGTFAVPVVEATAFDSNAIVEITNPGEGDNPLVFPGKSIIRVTNGDEETVYTITYTFGDLISNASRAVGKNFHAADGENVGSQLFSDRTTPAYVGNNPANGVAYYNDIRAISDEWDYLTGTDYFTSAVSAGGRPVTFTLNRDATVRVFSDSTGAINAEGWTRESVTDGYYMVASTTTGHTTAENSNKFTQMFSKKFSAGDEVTVSPTVMTAVIVVDYIGYVDVTAKLSSIEVNGEKLPGFNMDKNDYTMEIAPDTLTAPEVVATAFTDGAVVEVIPPEAFPGKTVIAVTEGEVTNEYTITYTSADLVASASRAVGRDFHAADDANATQSGGYMVGSPLFSDRSTPVTNAAGLAYFNDVRSISDEWDYLNGTDFFTTSVAAGGRPVTFTLNRKATIRVFALETNALNTADGWTKESKSDGFMKVSFTSGHIDESSCGQFGYMFYKDLAAGEEITVSPSVRDFVVVIDYAGYGEVIEEEEPADYAALTDITIDGVTIDGFDKEITDYAYEIAPDALVIPEITATAVNSDSEVEIINPGMGDNPNVFPGKTIIIVRSGSDEREYVIDYTYTGLSAITDMSSSNGGSFFAVNFHEPGDFGETYGSRLFYDRTAVPAYSGSTLAYYNDVREICDEMDYLKGRDYIMANRNLGANVTHTFTLLRPATIRVFHLTGYAAGNETLADWTTVVNDTAYIRTSHTTGSGVEGHAAYRETLGYGSMTYKEFDAGDEVSIASPGDHAIVVIDYAGYEN